VLGIQFMIPFVITKNIWYTFGVHWAGNIVYHLTNSVMHTTDGGHHLSAMAVAIVFAVVSIPIHFLISRQLTGGKAETTSFRVAGHSSATIRHSSSLT